MSVTIRAAPVVAAALTIATPAIAHGPSTPALPPFGGVETLRAMVPRAEISVRDLPRGVAIRMIADDADTIENIQRLAEAHRLMWQAQIDPDGGSADLYGLTFDFISRGTERGALMELTSHDYRTIGRLRQLARAFALLWQVQPTPDREPSPEVAPDPALRSRNDFERSGTAMATALLRHLDAKREALAPAIGTAVLEVHSERAELHVDAQLERGTHHVYLIDETAPCTGIDPEGRRLVGPPDPLRPEYLGSIVSNGERAHFERRIEYAMETHESVVERPLVLVRADGAGMICGVFRESSADAIEGAVSQR